MLKRAVAVTASCASLWLGALPQVSAQSLFAGVPSEDVGALPSRRPKTTAPEIASPIELEALRQETHPGLRASVLVPETVIKLVGAGFGDDAQGRIVRMKISGRAEGLELEILSWRPGEIRVRLPSLEALGIDAKAAVQMKSQLTPRKRVAGPGVEIGIEVEGTWAAKPKGAQIAVVYHDLDGDGHDQDDCDDLDARRYPGNTEQVDASGLDEDCDPSTTAEGALANVNDDLAL